jgi:hypothetical protein
MKTKKKIVCALFTLLVVVSSCIPSLHPLYTKKDLVLNNTIEGTWISNESDKDQSIWEIEKYDCGECNGPQELYPKNIDGKLYSLTNIQFNDTVVFELYILKLGDYFYFDFYPHDDYESDNELENMHLFPVHTFAKVDIENNTINIKQFDLEFLEELIRQNKIKISHEKSGRNIILTAPTEELQKFVEKYADDENAFNDPIILKRKI